MAMFMDDTPVFMIMLMGRWSSDTFLKYIRRQVLEFSKGMSRRMVKNEYLYAIPTHQSDSNDPRTQNQNSFATNLSLAPSSLRNNIQPAFSLWHWEKNFSSTHFFKSGLSSTDEGLWWCRAQSPRFGLWGSFIVASLLFPIPVFLYL